MEALRRATAAGDAFFAVDTVAAVVEDMGAMRADRRPVAALDALMSEKRQFRLRLAALRIVTPTAPQRTALQKNGRPNAWSVMHCKTLDIDQSAIHCHILSCFMKIYHAFSL
jgi:hypothetical protein